MNTLGSEPVSGYQDFTIFYVGNSTIGRGFDDVPTDNMWSFIVRTFEVNVVLVNAGQTNYGITLSSVNEMRIVAITLEQRDPGIFPFAARLTAYNSDGNLISVPGNPHVVPNNNFLRWSQTVGMTMGASGFSSQFLNGNTFETIVYDRVLEPAEMQSVMNYLKTKYPFIQPY
jgi:hypothetical protein